MPAGINPVDAIVLGIVVVSGLMAFARGLVREVLSVAAWVGAAFATLYAFSGVAPYVRPHFSSTLVADGATIGGVFLVSLIALSLVSHNVSRHVRDSALSAVDRSLGFGFGVLRGVVLVSLAYMFAIWLWKDPSEQPPWLRDARTHTALARGAQMLMGLVPDRAKDGTQGHIDAARERAEQLQQDADALRRMSTSVPVGAPGRGPAAGAPAAAVAPAPRSGTEPANAGAPQGEQGYKEQDRSGLDILFENAKPR
jgi:membrane protein required for colicin V production